MENWEGFADLCVAFYAFVPVILYAYDSKLKACISILHRLHFFLVRSNGAIRAYGTSILVFGISCMENMFDYPNRRTSAFEPKKHHIMVNIGQFRRLMDARYLPTR